jgi:hypothetical protein
MIIIVTVYKSKIIALNSSFLKKRLSHVVRKHLVDTIHQGIETGKLALAAANSFTSAAFPYWFPLTYNLVPKSLVPQNLELSQYPLPIYAGLQIRLHR